jgi:glycosyltransferase involved in cell wall biosynthesis
MSNPMVSIIVRTRNEERWIVACLSSVFNQDYKDIEVVIVDNNSTDKTIDKASKFGISNILYCENYKPGLALNLGIQEAKGKYIVCLSGHCIPVNEKWLKKLLDNFKDENVAGVYGRQEPLAFTSDSDKRDLSIIFGLDKKVQIKDCFFHNANSMLRRDVWEKVPFDEFVTNIEDRVWAREVLYKGYKIVYEPESSVYHYHGIHQDGDRERCRNVVKILEELNGGVDNTHLNVSPLNIVCIIPLRGDIQYLKEKPLISYTIESSLRSKYIKRTIVATDSIEVANMAKSLGAEVPFLREHSLSDDYIDIEHVLEYSMLKCESLGIFPDLLVSLEISFPFRSHNLIDNMIKQLVVKGLDTIIAVKPLVGSLWKEKEGVIALIEKGAIPRQYSDPTYLGLRGLCCVTHPGFIREGNLFGEKVGIFEVDNPFSHLEIRSEDDFVLAEKIAEMVNTL